MKNNKWFSFCFLIFVLFSILTNYAVLTTKEHEPMYRYFSNLIIILIYIISITLDILLVILIIATLMISVTDAVKQKKIYYSFYVVTISLVLLIWIELIYASTWYYGFGNHQNGLIANNWGIIGSVIFLCFTIFYSSNRLSKKLILFSLMLVAHILLYLILSPINILKL